MDFSLLLSPFSTTPPAGEDLTYDPCIDVIKEARFEEDPRLSQGVWERDVKKADWNEVSTRSFLLLQTRTKDLQLALWFCQAQLELHKDFKHLGTTLEFITVFCDRFWTTMYPQQDRLERIASLFSWFMEYLKQHLSLLPFTSPTDQAINGYCLYDYKRAQKFEQILRSQKEGKKKLQEAQDKGELGVEGFQKSLKKLSSLTAKALKDDLQKTKETFLKLQVFLNEHLEKEAPSFTNAFEILSEIYNLVSPFALDEEPKNESEDSSIGKESLSAVLPTTTVNQEPLRQELLSQGAFTGAFVDKKRQQLYLQIENIAKELLELEPHSPTPHILKEVRKWEDKSLGDIINFFGPQDFTLLLKKFGVVS